MRGKEAGSREASARGKTVGEEVNACGTGRQQDKTVDRSPGKEKVWRLRPLARPSTKRLSILLAIKTAGSASPNQPWSASSGVPSAIFT